MFQVKLTNTEGSNEHCLVVECLRLKQFYKTSGCLYKNMKISFHSFLAMLSIMSCKYYLKENLFGVKFLNESTTLL